MKLIDIIAELNGRGRNAGNLPGSGPGGYCVCPKCNTKVEHETGIPCYSMKCPKCGTPMIKVKEE